MSSTDKSESEASSDEASVDDELMNPNIQEAILDVNSNNIDWGTVFLTQLYKTEKFGEHLGSKKKGLIASAEVYDLYHTSPSTTPSIHEEEESLFAVHNLDDFFANPGDDVLLKTQKGTLQDAKTSKNIISGKCGTSLMVRTPSSSSRMDRGAQCQTNTRPSGRSCRDMNCRNTNCRDMDSERRRQQQQGWKSTRGQQKRDKNKKEEESAPLPPLPNSIIMKNMMKWYIHNSVSDLLWKISVSLDLDEYPSLILSLFALPIEENEWSWPYISTQIYKQIMNNPLVTVDQQVMFWQSLHALIIDSFQYPGKTSCDSMNLSTMRRLTPSLEVQIGLVFKGENNQLLPNFPLFEETERHSQSTRTMLQEFFSKLFKFSTFLGRMIDNELLDKNDLLGHLLLLVTSNDCLCDIKKLALFLATFNHVANSLEEKCFNRYYNSSSYLPKFSGSQLGFIQLYAKLWKFIANGSATQQQQVIPSSIVHFINGMVFCWTEKIHLQFRKQGLQQLMNTAAYDGRRIDASEVSRWRQEITLDRTASGTCIPMDLMLEGDLINEFYKWIIESYCQLRVNEAKFANETEGKTLL